MIWFLEMIIFFFAVDGSIELLGYATNRWNVSSDEEILFLLRNISKQIENITEFNVDSYSVSVRNENKLYLIKYSARIDSEDSVGQYISAYVITPGNKAVVVFVTNKYQEELEETYLDILGSIR